ncbi:MAG: hypothetical protein K5668_11215 [Lachnospiraceae bacterium]|nr:hypothetical protein [Lachnospiraceae bacterium]
MKKTVSLILILITFFCLPLTVYGEINGPALTKLDNHSMRPNNNVMGIHIGEGIESIASDTFRNQVDLKFIEVAPGNPYFSSFSYCLYDKDMTTLICFPQALDKAEIPGTVTKINQYALYGVEPEISNAVKEAIKNNAARRGEEYEYLRYNTFPYANKWPYTCEYPLTN